MKSTLPPCNDSVTIESLSRTFPSNCGEWETCERTEYEIISHEETYIETSGFSVGYKQDIEDHQNSWISVDEQTLIGQVGGILGILFGWSGMTLVDMIGYIGVLFSAMCE